MGSNVLKGGIMKANWVFLKTAIILISINLILTGFLQITITRPIIYYEYLVLPFILIRLNNSKQKK